MDKLQTKPRTDLTSTSRFLELIDDPWFRLVVDLQNAVSVTTMAFWGSRGLKTMHLPITTGSISSPMGKGSDSRPVKVNLHGVETYLADSMQFMLEYGCRLSPQGTYYIMPSFRDEATDKTHLAQFFHSEAEIPGGLDDVIAVVEDYLRYLASSILDMYGEHVRSVCGTTSHIEHLATGTGAFRRLTFDEAVGILGSETESIEVGEAGWRTLTRTGEQRLLAEFGDFVWVSHWDHLSVPFYQAFAPNGKSALNADLLFGLGEIVGAGERHATGDDVLKALRLHEVSAEAYYWYVQLKTSFPLQTSGFGLGIERFLAWVLRHDDIRDLQVLPRENGRNIIP